MSWRRARVWRPAHVRQLQHGGCQVARSSLLPPAPPAWPACLPPPAAAPLEGYPPTAWVAFDRVMVVKDVYTGGVRTFLARQDAHLFRKMLYAQASARRGPVVAVVVVVVGKWVLGTCRVSTLHCS